MVKFSLIFLLGLVAACLGCDAKTHFEPNVVLRASNRLTVEQGESIDRTITKLFGTPDVPQLPEMITTLDLAALSQAAGPVISYKPGVTQGLFRRHCARCHGVTGDGRGPSAYYQHPYPRDFRHGVFKWKSTYRDAPPTDADLLAVLERGVPGTAMPSFRLLTSEERDMLRQYVTYLAMRGELERQLVWFVAEELGPDEPLPAEEALSIAHELLKTIAGAWEGATDEVVEVEMAESTAESIRLGHELYHGEQSGCVKCHGAEGEGGRAPDDDYDDWNRERLAVSEVDAKLLPFTKAPARAITGSRLRGGDAPIDLFRRLHQGVAGTPMPAIGPRRPGEESALSDEEVAALADYVRSIMEVDANHERDEMDESKGNRE